MKKFTLLGLLLLSAIGLTANAAVSYSWQVKEGNEFKNLTEGAEIAELSEAMLTISGIENPNQFDGNYANTNNCGLYRKSDNKQISSFGYYWCPYSDLEVVDGSISFTLPIQESEAFPDYPVRTDGEYYIKIEEGFFRFDIDPNNYTKHTASEELIINFTIKSEPAFVAKSDVTISPAEGTLKQCPNAWVVNINKDFTSAKIAEGAKAQFLQSSWDAYDLIPEIDAANKTLTLYPSEELIENFPDLWVGDYKLVIFDGAIIFNDDETCKSGLMQFDYQIPELVEFNSSITFPKTSPNFPSTVTSLNSVELYFYSQRSTVELPEPNADKSNVTNLQKLENGVWTIVGYYDAVEIPSVVIDEYENYSYTGVKLTLNSETPCEAGEYKIVVPLGAFTVVTAATEYDPSQRLENKYFESRYYIAEAPEVSTTPVWGAEQNAVYESFSEINVSFAGISTAAFYDQYSDEHQAMLYRINADGTRTRIGNMSADNEFNSTTGKEEIMLNADGSIKLYMTEDKCSPYYPLDIDGEYVIELVKATFIFNGFSDMINEASEYRFKVVSNSAFNANEITLDPAPGTISEIMQQVAMTLDNKSIETLEIAMETYWGYDDNWNYVELTEPMRAELIDAKYGFSTGYLYLITVNPENPRQLTLTLDPRTVYGDPYLDYGSYALRIPRGALIANKGTETECTNTVLDLGPWTKEQCFYGEIYSPSSYEVVEQLAVFKIDFIDSYGELQVNEQYAAEIYKFDEITNEWNWKDCLVAEIATDEATGEKIAQVRLPYDPIVSSGKYRVIIPENTFVFEYEGTTLPTAAIEADFTVISDIKPYTLELNPEEGDVPFVDNFAFRFADDWLTGAYSPELVWFGESVPNAAVAFDAEGNKLGTASLIDWCYDEKGSMWWSFKFENAIRTEGVCRIVIASNLFDTTYDGEGDSECFELKYNVVPGAPILSITPADGETVKDLSAITLTWYGATELTVDNTLTAELYTEAEDGTRALYSALNCITNNKNEAQLSIADSSKEMANGKYVVVIPAEMFSANGYLNDAIEHDYTLAAITYELTVVEEPMAKLQLTISNCDEVKVNEDCKGQITLWKVNTGGVDLEDIAVGTYAVTLNENVAELTLEGDVTVEDGNYAVTIPEEFFWVGNDKSKAMTFDFEVVSVESLAGETNFDIYSVNGMVIKRNANQFDLKALNPGVYVINGQKVLIRK